MSPSAARLCSQRHAKVVEITVDGGAGAEEQTRLTIQWAYNSTVEKIKSQFNAGYFLEVFLAQGHFA